MTKNIKKKERVAWADLCKGLLITLLMFSHLIWLSHSRYEVDNQVINVIGNYSVIWGCFFMSCFFLISGFFSNFNKPAKDFIWSQFKGLIFPALVLLALNSIPHLNYSHFIDRFFLFGGGQWFLAALFLSKIFLWSCIKWIKNKESILAILLVMSFAGKFLDDANLFPNYWYHRNFMHFTLFLGLGYYYKDFLLKKTVGIVSSIAFTLTIVLLYMMKFHVPSVVSVFNETLIEHPLSIWLSITGSISCIHLCKYIGHNSVLEYLGKVSLIVYIYHLIFLRHSISALSKSLCDSTFIDSVIQVFMIVASTLVFSCFLARVMDYKYLKWMKGSF